MRVAVHQASIEYSRAFTWWRTLLHVERLALLLRLDLLLGCASCLARFCRSAAWPRLETTTVRECALRCNRVAQSKSLRDALDRHNAAGMKHTMECPRLPTQVGTKHEPVSRLRGLSRKRQAGDQAIY